VALAVNLARKNIHTRDPGFIDLALTPVRTHKFAGVEPSLRKLLRERCPVVIAGTECISSAGVDTLPEVVFALAHVSNVMSSEIETSRCDTPRYFYGIPRLRFAPLGMTFQLSSSEKSPRSRERFGL
jgi:hypothetical protein